MQASREIKALYSKSKNKHDQETYDRILELIHNRLSISSDQAKKTFPLVFRYSETVHEHKVVVILTSTLLEELLAEQLVLLRILKGMKRGDAWKDVERLSGFRNLCEDFKKFNGISIATAMGQSIGNFYSDWIRIVNARNTFIHGIPFAIDAATAEVAFNLAKSAFPLFAYLQNRFCAKDNRKNLK